MANNRELSQFGSYVTVNDTDKTVGIATTVNITTGGLYVGGVQAIRPNGTWGGSSAGIQGAQGTQGIQGTQGTQGVQGTQGTTGAQGATGSQGTTGAQGATGTQGTLGTQGTSGPVTLASGTLMLFQQTAAPTGWTKQTTHNDKALRVVSGTASSGGSTAFTSVFASRTPSGSVSGSNSGGSVSNFTLTTTEMPSHTHEGPLITSANDSFYGRGRSRQGIFGQSSGTNTICLQESVGGSSAHGHGFTNPSWSGSFTGTAMDFSVQYVDLIIASKD